MTTEAPGLFEAVALNEDGYDALPKPVVPYTVIADEGYFTHRRTQIGNVLLPTYTRPKLGKTGYPKGIFEWDARPVPASIISQAHDFFLRIYTKHHAEAEVIITMHNDTGDFRLFVPYQRVSHAGVKSIFEPTHIDRNYTVVGTLHSHCDFSAFHSGTDSGDASDMDGVHFTIGKVNQPQPEIVAMVAMGGKEFHYHNVGDIAEVRFGVETAPPWWDQYVLTSPPEEKPKSLVSLTQADWNEFLGRALRKPKQQDHQRWTPPVQPQHERKPGWVSPYQQSRPIPLPAQGYHATKPSRGEDWDWRAEVYGGRQSSIPQIPKNTGVTWGPDGELVTGIPELDTINKVLETAEAKGIFTDGDWRLIAARDMDEIEFWQKFFFGRMNDVIEVLALLNIDININAKHKKGKK